MKKIMSIIFLCAGFALCDEIAEESSADVVENAATETETVENQTQALAPTEKTVKSDSNSFEEIVKGYMLLALLEHGLDSESISLVQLDAVFDRYTKSEAAETYRREC